jgi:hypothetical protein
MKKVAMVTGASRGIGRETAVQLAKAGFNLAISTRTIAEGELFEHSVKDAKGASLSGSLNETAELARSFGSDVLVLKMDLLDSNSIRDCAEQALAHFGHIDLLINNAIYQGSDLNSPLSCLTEETLLRVAQAYLISPTLLIQALLPSMQQRSAGIIINITSGAGESDPPLAATKGGWGYAYGAGKAAVSRLSGVISREYGKGGVRAFTVNPGVVSTDTLLATLGTENLSALSSRLGKPEDIAAVLVWLAQLVESDPDQARALEYQTLNAQHLAEKFQILDSAI